MKIQKYDCPYCGGNIGTVDIGKNVFITCPYCRQKIYFDNEEINKNVNITKNIQKRYIDDAEVIRAQIEAKENRNKILSVIIPIVACVILMLISSISIEISNMKREKEKEEAIAAGKIIAGFSHDLEGKDYKTVEAHFKAAGFTNIELINLNDHGLKMWKKGKVETISIGGDTYFDTDDYFEPNIKIVISYH